MVIRKKYILNWNRLWCSAEHGWMNPPLRFDNEACRHKILDLIGDLSLVAQGGNGGFPVAHVVAFKASATFRLSSSFLWHQKREQFSDKTGLCLYQMQAGHALHTELARHLTIDWEEYARCLPHSAEDFDPLFVLFLYPKTLPISEFLVLPKSSFITLKVWMI